MDSDDTVELAPGTTPSKQARPSPYLVPVVFEKESPVASSANMKDEECYGCIIGDEKKPKLEAALKSLGLTVFYSSDGKQVPDFVPDECDMVFICEEFNGPVFDYLHSRKFRIIGPPCVFSCAARGETLPSTVRPLYTDSMREVTLCFTGFKDREVLHHYYKLAYHMGARVSRDVSSTVTHIVAHTVGGSKYKVAVIRGTAIMSSSWVEASWERRYETGFKVSQLDTAQYKQLPFTGCVIALHGFPSEEEEHMTEIASSNGAVVSQLGASGDMKPVTHLVVCNEVDVSTLPHTSSRIYVVKQQWFWESIQIDVCADENFYRAKESCRRSRPRQSLNSSLHTSINSLDISCLLEASLFSLSSPKNGKRDHKHSPTTSPMATPTSGVSYVPSRSKADAARHHIASELLHTEKNFVNILNIIVRVFKEPLERPQQRGGQILSHEDIKSIFGNIPEILAVHQELVSGLEEQLSNWSETSCIGQVLLKQSEGFLKVYPPFVNFFDMSKEALHKCDRAHPRFHAFLKSNECRPECSRQTLAELLITPVQRIPRILLLIQDLVKRTDTSHPDHSALQSTVDSLKTVMTHINEDRRKTEGQMHMFEVLRDVEGCPATVLSAQRSFVRRLDVTDIGNPGKTGGKGEALSIFLFSDSIEIAKRRTTSNFTIRNSSHKAFKHVEFIPLSHIRSIVHFGDTGDFSQCFGILVRWPGDPQEQLLVFRLVGEGSTKTEVIQELSKMMASVNCSTDPGEFVMCSSSDILTSMMKYPVSSSRSLKKALHGAKKKVKRALSGRQNRKVRLSSASCHNLHQVVTGDENEPMDVPVLPESPNTSSGSVCSILPSTPVPTLRTPRPKRFALSSVPTFSSIDLRNIGTEV